MAVIFGSLFLFMLWRICIWVINNVDEEESGIVDWKSPFHVVIFNHDIEYVEKMVKIKDIINRCQSLNIPPEELRYWAVVFIELDRNINN